MTQCMTRDAFDVNPASEAAAHLFTVARIGGAINGGCASRKHVSQWPLWEGDSGLGGSAWNQIHTRRTRSHNAGLIQSTGGPTAAGTCSRAAPSGLNTARGGGEGCSSAILPPTPFLG